MQWLQTLDYATAKAVTTFGDGSTGMLLVNRAADVLLDANLIKMGPLVLLLFYTWLRQRSADAAAGGLGGVLVAPSLVLRSLLGVLLALGIGRLLQEILPMRPRPRFAHPDLAFPSTGYGFGLGDWSSLPSDHAMLVFAIVGAIWAASARLGLLAAAWGTVMVCFPRILLGFHYVSDVVVGAVLGIVIMHLAMKLPPPAAALDWLRRLDARRPSLVVLGLCLLGWEITDLFGTSRRIAAAFGTAARIIADGSG